ncbi:MAG TPA: alanine--tRNA ligase, partial [Cryomorphaceae bacterium]|nr:alanine--tRNA ligase [Cryomorphaceae bacterium]
MAAAGELENNAEDHGGVRVIAARTAMDTGSLKDMVFKLKGQGNTLVIFANAWEGKATVSIGISDEVVGDKGWHAGNAVRALAQHIQGGGGGQPAFATAGGKNPEGLDKVLSDWKNHFVL